MSRVVGKELPEALWLRLDGHEVESHEGKIIPIFTTDEGGWPHPALLSYYEVVAKDKCTLNMALWKESSTAMNLRRAGKVTLLMTDAGMNYYVKGRAEQLEYEMKDAAPVSKFRIVVEQIIEDQEPNAEITTGMTYRRMTKRDANDFAAKVFRLLYERA
jgi:hypothetical protein